MKKKFLNDFRSAIIFTTCAIALIFIMFLGLNNINKTQTSSILIIISLFGGGVLMCIVGVLLTFELITFHNNKITSFTIRRRVEIYFSEITGIQMIKKVGIGDAGVANVWEIKDNNDNTINIIYSNKRTEMLMQIKEIREKISS